MFPLTGVSPRSAIRRLAVAAGAFIAIAAIPLSGAYAAPITFAYEGVISSTDAPLISVNGQTLRLEYTFESTTIDQNLSPFRGTYLGITSISATIGGATGSAASGSIDVLNNAFSGMSPVDQFQVVAILSGMVINGASLLNGHMVLFDPSATAFSNDLLPTVHPDPFDFVSAQSTIVLNFVDLDSNLATLSVSNISIATTGSAVPEPGMFAVFVLGFAGLAAARRRRAA